MAVCVDCLCCYGLLFLPAEVIGFGVIFMVSGGFDL